MRRLAAPWRAASELRRIEIPSIQRLVAPWRDVGATDRMQWLFTHIEMCH